MNEGLNGKPTSLRKFFYVVFKRKTIILTLFLSVVITAVVGSFMLSPVYRATSHILVERDIKAEKALLFKINPGVFQAPIDEVVSEIVIIKCRPVVERVLKALKLENLPVEVFQNNLSVERVKDSNIITVSYQAEDPSLAAAAVNKVVDTYIQYRSEIFKDTKAYKFFDQQMKLADRRLNELERREADFKREQKLILPQQESEILLKKLSDFEEALTQVKKERIGRQARLEILRSQMNDSLKMIIPSTEISDSPSQKDHINRLKSELLTLEMRKTQLLQTFTPGYIGVVNLEEQIKATEEKIRQEVEQIIRQEEIAIEALLAEERVLESTIDDIHKKIKELSQQIYQLSELSRGIDDNREVYSMLLKQREEARISMAKMGNIIKIRVISPAVAPKAPIKPKRRLIAMMAVFLGIGLGLGAAFVAEYFDHSISTPEDVENYLGLPLLTSLGERAKGKTASGQPYI